MKAPYTVETTEKSRTYEQGIRRGFVWGAALMFIFLAIWSVISPSH